MNNPKIEASRYTPEIFLDCEKNLFVMRGDSYPEDIEEFYQPVLSSLKSHLDHLKGHPFVADMELIYFNSGTARVLTDMFDMLEEASTGNIVINWVYDEENESAEEFGEEFQEDLESLEFNLVQIER